MQIGVKVYEGVRVAYLRFLLLFFCVVSDFACTPYGSDLMGLCKGVAGREIP